MESIELKIRELLIKVGDSNSVAGQLFEWWEDNQLTAEEKYAVACFAIRSGRLPDFLKLIAGQIKNHELIPWGPFVEALGLSGYQPQKPEVLALFQGAHSQKDSAGLVRSRALDQFSSKFAEERRNERQEERRRYNEIKRNLIEQLEFYRSQRIPTEEKKILAQLSTLFPHDSEVRGEHMVHQEKWAREIINQRERMTEYDSHVEEQIEIPPPEVLSSKDHLVAQVKKEVKLDPDSGYDYAIMFEALEFYREAYEILRISPPSAESDWLALELLIKGRQYLSALEEANRLEIQYAGNPESTFAVIYARARALWGLGQKDHAIDLLKSIVSLRPTYRSARALLREWTGDSL